MEQKSIFLYGKHSVKERLRANPKSILKVFVGDNFDQREIIDLIKAKRIPCQRLKSGQFKRLKTTASLGGIIAEVERFRYHSLDDLFNKPDSQKRVLLFLDRIFDPQNLGSIIRSVACFGHFAIVIPRHKACEVNETVLRVACGGENYIPLVMVSNLTNSILKAKKHGYWIGAAVISDGQDLSETKFNFPLGIVFGSEGKGVRYGVKKHIDFFYSIPMRGAPLSLNVNVACAILCYQICSVIR